MIDSVNPYTQATPKPIRAIRLNSPACPDEKSGQAGAGCDIRVFPDNPIAAERRLSGPDSLVGSWTQQPFLYQS
jgi:hypothetical protein